MKIKLPILVIPVVLVLCLSLLGAAAPQTTETKNVTRGEFIRALYEVHENLFKTEFTDDTAVAWAQEAGIVKGFEDGQLRLEEPITQSQAAVILYRYAETLAVPQPVAEDTLAGYEDVAEVPAWCRDEVAWAVANDLWFSGSRFLGANKTLTAADLEVIVQAVHQLGMPLEENWTDINTCDTVTLKLESISTDYVVFRLENKGEQFLVYDAAYGLYQEINGGWYSLNSDQAVIAIGHTLGAGDSVELKTYSSLAPGNYRFTKGVTVGTDDYLLAADFTIS